MKITKLFTLVCAIILAFTLLLTSCGSPTVSGPENNNAPSSKDDPSSESNKEPDKESSQTAELTAEQWENAFDLSKYNSFSISLNAVENTVSAQSLYKYKDGSIYIKHVLTEDGKSETDEFIDEIEALTLSMLNPLLEELMYELTSAESFGLPLFSYSEQTNSYNAKMDLYLPQTDVSIFFNGTSLSKITLSGKGKIDDAAEETTISLTLEISDYNSTTLPEITESEEDSESNTTNPEKPAEPTSDEEKYNSALSLIAENNYAEAMELLASLKNYAPAQEKLKNFFWAPRTVSTRWRDSDNIEAGGNDLAYTYDSMGNILSVTDDEGITEYTYDEKGNRLTEKSADDELTYTYTNGKLTQIKGSISTTTYEYNEKGLIAKITVTIDDGIDVYSHETSYEYTYYDNGTVKSILKDNYFEYRYSEDGVLEDLIGFSDYAAQTAEFSLTPTFGTHGITSMELQGIFGESTSVAYTYDANGRLKSIEALIYQDEELTYTYTFGFDEYMLFYSENPASAKEISIICFTDIDTMLEEIW